MILVADSGSTKCDWMLIADNGSRIEASTLGINPLFHDEQFIVNELSKNKTLSEFANQVTAVHFYGAGCSSPDRNSIVEAGLRQFFNRLSSCQVEHDLKGACVATAGKSTGITCILGTGSNSCYFDGSLVHEEIPSLGYILGDEGSGSFFGKKLLSDWLYKSMPQDLHQDFGSQYELGKEKILDAVYRKPNANVYLAQFMKFTSLHKEHDYIRDMIYAGFCQFAKIHITCFANYKEVPVHFVGSIAYHFQDILSIVASEIGFSIGVIEKRPIDALTNYHQKEDSSNS